MVRDYERIVAWQRAHQLTLQVYRSTGSFPEKEKFGVTSQLRRAAYSVASNIVEGSARNSTKEYLHFLSIAWGSLKETEYFLLLARDLGYLSSSEHTNLKEIVNQTFAPLRGLIKAVGKET